MNDERHREIENSESWDYERPQMREPVKASRVVVSVAFRREDFAQISVYAERWGKKVSEFIREAAIEKATGQGKGMLVYGGGSSGTSWWLEQLPPLTQVTGAVKRSEEALAITH